MAFKICILCNIRKMYTLFRRLKKDVLDDLPAKRREIIYLSSDSINHRMKRLHNAHNALVIANKSAVIFFFYKILL